MNPVDLLLVLVIAAAFALAVRRCVRVHKKGGCSCGCCDGCGGCETPSRSPGTRSGDGN